MRCSAAKRPSIPGLDEADHYDLSATGVGVVEADDILGPDRVRPGDVIIAMGSSGLHSNGHPLARKVLLEIDRMSLAGHVDDSAAHSARNSGTDSDLRQGLPGAGGRNAVRIFCHVTGGGLAGNLERIVPNGLIAEIDRGSWTPAPVFGLIAHRGRVERAEMEKTFNMGVGMVALVAPEDTDRPGGSGFQVCVTRGRDASAWKAPGTTRASPGSGSTTSV